MNAIVPLNIAAVRVSKNDSTNVVGLFAGREANFDNLPYQNDDGASTGDTVVQSLDASPLNQLGPGIHLHWELPDFFRRGTQDPDGGPIRFPPVPNRWLVIRYLTVFDQGTNQWSPVAPQSWIVESDYISASLIADSDGTPRPAAPVPLPSNPGREQPFRYMGRVVDAATWNPSSESAANYLPAFNGPDGKAYHLTANGFLGPGFSAYYPDCCSVFGFWDRFLDNKTIFEAIKGNQAQFRASYQVIGWIAAGAADPLDDMSARVQARYNYYVEQCAKEGTDVVTTPAEVFDSIAKQDFHWSFNRADIAYTLNADKTLATLDSPGKTICAGIMQEIVWNLDGGTYFLANPDPDAPSIGVWTDTVEVAVGNTPVEALSALLKKDMGNADDDPDLLKNYEYLLDAFQLGMLNDLEQETNKIIELEEALHSNGFASRQGGLVWTVQPPEQDPTKAQDADAEITLPLDLAEALSVLNAAQKNYDMARAALDMRRKQLFMDWYRYVKMKAAGITDPNVTIDQLIAFLDASTASELITVKTAGEQAGILTYLQDGDSRAIIGVATESSPSSAAGRVAALWKAFKTSLPASPEWTVIALPGTPFWVPTEPVALMEGDRIEPVRRNGLTQDIFVRLSTELVSVLSIGASDSTFRIDASSIAGLPVLNNALPYGADMQALVGEGALVIPLLAFAAANALAAQGGTNNPAVEKYSDFLIALNAAQGGLSPLENPLDGGLFAMVRADGYEVAANPVQSVSAPMVLSVTFTNSDSNGWPLSPVGWNAQLNYPELTPTRYDPFLPVSMIWEVTMDALKPEDDNSYTASNLTHNFQLDTDAIDYQYKMNGGVPVPFTTGNPVAYNDSVVLSKKPTFSLTRQIDNYVSNFPKDPADPTLELIAQAYNARRIMSQSISGYSLEQTLASYIAQIPVEDLTVGPARDPVTKHINDAAVNANPGDNWYNYNWNSQAPVATGLAAQLFGPLRSGFLQFLGLQIVDVFGQRMVLNTAGQKLGDPMQPIVAMTMQPMPGDSAHASMIYLPPRILTPTRLWFRWLSAVHNDDVPGVSADFVEMNAHPATSPVCGWVVPNHLDNSLFFYDGPGNAIGSFGVEHGDLVYRTRPGNGGANPGNDLELDIGSRDLPSPKVNPHLATFMWYIDAQPAAFLTDLMAAILNSDQFIDPASFAQDANLAVLIGRPLAITRAILGMETAGSVLPLSQADAAPDDPWPSDIKGSRYDYADRMKTSSANLDGVEFPVRLGDLANIDDGLVGYLIEAPTDQPYGTFYSPAAPGGGQNGVTAPEFDTIQLTLNSATLIALTMLVDPRAAIHATVGVLPVEEISIPPDQYSETMRNLQMTFATMPVLNERQGLVLPLPAESGYTWSWVPPGALPDIPLVPNAGNDNAIWGYTPQTLLEGWLRLQPDPNKPPPSKNNQS